MSLLIFDTETTGIPINGTPLSDPRQPRIVQLAAELCDDEGEVIADINAIIRPDGWSSIPEGPQRAHGISIERCFEEGRCMKDVLKEFNDLKELATARAAYNITFDKKMLFIESHYHGFDHNSDKFRETSYCIMKMATPICNLPPTQRMKSTGFDKPKNPKLIEAYRFFFERDFERAHDAMNDVRATKEILFHIKKNHPDHFAPLPPREPYQEKPEKAERVDANGGLLF